MQETSDGRPFSGENDRQVTRPNYNQQAIYLVDQRFPHHKLADPHLPIQEGTSAYCGQAMFSQPVDSDGSASLSHISDSLFVERATHTSPSLYQSSPAITNTEQTWLSELQKNARDSEHTNTPFISQPSIHDQSASGFSGTNMNIRSDGHLKSLPPSSHCLPQQNDDTTGRRQEDIKTYLEHTLGIETYGRMRNKCFISFLDAGKGNKTAANYADQLVYFMAEFGEVKCLQCHRRGDISEFTHTSACLIQRAFNEAQNRRRNDEADIENCHSVPYQQRRPSVVQESPLGVVDITGQRTIVEPEKTCTKAIERRGDTNNGSVSWPPIPPQASHSKEAHSLQITGIVEREEIASTEMKQSKYMERSDADNGSVSWPPITSQPHSEEAHILRITGIVEQGEIASTEMTRSEYMERSVVSEMDVSKERTAVSQERYGDTNNGPVTWPPITSQPSHTQELQRVQITEIVKQGAIDQTDVIAQLIEMGVSKERISLLQKKCGQQVFDSVDDFFMREDEFGNTGGSTSDRIESNFSKPYRFATTGDAVTYPPSGPLVHTSRSLQPSSSIKKLGPEMTPGPPLRHRPNKMNASYCGACKERKATILQYDCGHIVCKECAPSASDLSGRCKMCSCKVVECNPVDTSRFQKN